MAGAKGYFIGLGLVQQILLKFVLGLDGYGALSSALSLSSILYNTVVTTSIQGVSRAVAQAPEAERPATTRRALSVHAVLALPLGAAAFLAAGPVGTFTGMPHVVMSLRLGSVIVVAYGLYAPLIGVLNGSRRFGGQALFDVAAATFRTVGLVGGGLVAVRLFGRGPEGAMAGFVAAAVLVLVAAVVVVGTGRSGRSPLGVREHLLFIGPLALGQLLLNLLFQADLTVLRAFASRAATTAGLPVEAADPLIGAYRATQLFSFLPYQLLLAITFVLFPLLAAAHRARDRDAVRDYVRAGMRLALVIAGVMVSVSSGLARELLTSVFGQDAAELGSNAMELLTLGFGAFAIFGILTTVLNSIGRERESAIVTVVALALVIGLGALGLSGTAFAPALLLRTAVATSLGILVATVSAAILVRRATGGLVPTATAVRVGTAVAVSVVLGRCLPDLGLTGNALRVLTVGYAGAVAIVYASVLLLTRELGAADLALVRRVLRR
ncbi:MAG: lipopolysaccharide biosynthesis protein [Polyangiaceae bacterium]|nr:lipopolysaccharide biosynthesis protein [Polyangiaceae bacterium]